MAKKNEKIAAGLAGLMQTAQAKKAAEAAQETKAEPAAPQLATAPDLRESKGTEPTRQQPQKGNYKTVCYSIPPDVAEEIKRIAYIDRRTIGAVVTEAFREYIDKWGSPEASTCEACNTDCPAYASGTCQYFKKTECPRFRRIYKIKQ